MEHVTNTSTYTKVLIELCPRLARRDRSGHDAIKIITEKQIVNFGHCAGGPLSDGTRSFFYPLARPRSRMRCRFAGMSPGNPCHFEDAPMIYEVRTYTLRPGTVAEFEERYEKRLPLRLKHSPLGGFWHTEFGPLNQVIHVYPYDDLAQRTAVRDALAKDTARAQIQSGREFVVAQ